MLTAFKATAYHLALYFSNYWVNRIPCHAIRLFYYRRIMRFTIGKRGSILMGVIFDAPRKFSMGASSVINRGCKFGNRGGITIGDNVSISEEVFVLAGDHDVNDPAFPSRFASVTINDHAFIGSRAVILKGVHIGKGGVVAAGAVVHRDVPPFTIVAGNPAREIGKRNPDLQYTLNYRPPLA